MSQLLLLLPVSVASLGKSNQSIHTSVDSSQNESG